MAKGYWVACVNVINQNEFNKYVALAGPAVNLHGGKFLVRGGSVLKLKAKRMKGLLFLFLILLKRQKNVMNQKNINMHIVF